MNSRTNRKLKKIGRLAYNLYPELDWSIGQASPEINDTYGKGFIIRAGERSTGRQTEYFILFEDPRVENWIHMIADELENNNVE